MAGIAALTLALNTLLAASAGEYAGSKACEACHKALYDNYRRTAMGRSMADAAEAVKLAAPAEIRDGDQLFGVASRDGSLYQWQSLQDGSIRVEHKLQWAVGSGVNGFSFVIRRGDHLFQAPLSYYARRGEWALSPGFESGNPGFTRPIHEACIACHSGRPRAVADRQGRYDDPPFDELAIGCENCHGPGRAHAAQRARIVNPAKLPPRLAEDICMYCHQTGDTRVVQPGKRLGDFRPGRPLHETVAIFRLESSIANTDLLEHHEAMKASRCFTASGGKLGCLSCHNPHRMPEAAQRAAYYRGRCESCHRQKGCKLALEARQAKDNDCAGCHMPKRELAEISHSALTLHRISLSGASAPAAPSAALPGLVYLNRPTPFALPLLTRLTAYGELSGRDASLVPHYLDALALAAAQQPQHPLVLASLGRKALREGSFAGAVPSLERAVAKGAVFPAAYDLAEALSKMGREADAIPVLEKAVAAEPYTADLRKSLILRLINTKQFDAARTAMRAYLEIFPSDAFMRGLLAKVDR